MGHGSMGGGSRVMGHHMGGLFVRGSFCGGSYLWGHACDNGPPILRRLANV